MKAPVYVVSKGRYDIEDKRSTMLLFHKHGVPFTAVVYRDEIDQYRDAMPFVKNWLVVPRDSYESHLWHKRRWLHEHSIENGERKHFQIDDDIEYFGAEVCLAVTVTCHPGLALDVLEAVHSRFANIGISGLKVQGRDAIGIRYGYQKAVAGYVNAGVIFGVLLIDNKCPATYDTDILSDLDFSASVIAAGWNTLLLAPYFHKTLIDKKSIEGGLQVEYKNEFLALKRVYDMRAKWSTPIHGNKDRKIKDLKNRRIAPTLEVAPRNEWLPIPRPKFVKVGESNEYTDKLMKSVAEGRNIRIERLGAEG